MVTLKGEKVFLRALEPEDLDFIYAIENNEEVWEMSLTQTPYSKFLIRQYLDNSHKDIFQAKQLRLVISNYEKEPIGLIDLFDFEPAHKRAGIGILIANKNDRAKGYGSEALQLLLKYTRKQLNLHQVYANISEENHKSIQLFERFGFERIGVKKDWNYINGIYKNELLYQLRYVH